MTSTELPAPSAGSANLLEITDLNVAFPIKKGLASVVVDLNLSVRPGETVGIVGESGSGKTVTALSITGLVQEKTRAITTGRINYDDKGDLLSLSRRQLRDIRGRSIGMIFQEPRRSLDPSFTVGHQIAEVARQHLKMSRSQAIQRAVELLDRVEIADARRRARDYPHMLSGGMCQRVMIALALVASPKLLIADEPTTALDVTVQARVLELMRGLQDELDLSILLITHDLGVVAEMCDRTAVMYAGQVVELGPTASVFEAPTHPYTEGLLNSLPQRQERSQPMGAIKGVVPAPHAWPSGCHFAPRCDYAIAECEAPVTLLDRADGRACRCIRQDELRLRGIT